MKVRLITLSPWLLTPLIDLTLAMTKWMDATDLTNFIPRPEIKVPQLMLKKHQPDLITPGYIFMAPYIRAEQEAFTKYYQPCQVGPTIYDSEGELVWSGACIFSNRNVYDFRLIRDSGGNSTALSAIVGPIRMQPGSKGFGVILGSILEGNLGSVRMSTYRTYKFGIDEVRLFPAEPIALVCQTVQLSSGEPSADKLSVMYVSWNGATEVTKWQFAVSDNENVEQGNIVILGSKEKSSFETIAQFSFNQVRNFAVAYALDAAGNVLGKSTPVACIDIVKAGSKSHQFEDPTAYYNPSGSFSVRPPVVNPGSTLSTSDGNDEDDFHNEQEGGNGVVEAEVDASPAAASSDEMKKQQKQTQQPPTPSPSPPPTTSTSLHTPPTTSPIKPSFLSGGESPPRPITILLFLSVALAGMLLLVRRRIRRQV